MNTYEMQDELSNALEDSELAADGDIRSIYTFNEAGVLSSNAGLVVQLEDGTEFQVTIVESTRY